MGAVADIDLLADLPDAAANIDLLAGLPTPARSQVAVVPEKETARSFGGYDGAKRFDQLGNWNSPLRTADQEVLPSKPVLDARAHDTLRNDGYVAGGAALHKDNIVGAQYRLNARPKSLALFGKVDPVWEREFQAEVETKFNLAAESDRKWFDAKGTKTLTDIVRLAVGAYVAGGEVLSTAQWLNNRGRPFNTAIQMIDPQRLSDPMIKSPGIRTVGGVEIDQFGAPVAYHIRNGRQYNQLLELDKWVRVPARRRWGRQMVLHIFEETRPEQTRGVAAMVSALSETRMTKELRKVELQRAVVAATYAASMESELPDAQIFQMMGGGDAPKPGDNPTLDWMEDYLGAVERYTGGAKNLLIDGARIPILPPGTKLKVQAPTSGGPMGDRFEQSLLRYIAAALGVSYEQLSRDYSQTNYSSARTAIGETRRFMASRKRMVADGTANFVYRLWLEEMVNANAIEALKRPNIPNWYDGLNADAYSNCEWLGAGWGMIDPLKETQALVLQVNSGLTTRERAAAQIHGSDYRDDFQQMAREKEEAEAFGLNFQGNTDMTNALSGTPRDGQPSDASEVTEDED